MGGGVGGDEWKGGLCLEVDNRLELTTVQVLD